MSPLTCLARAERAKRKIWQCVAVSALAGGLMILNACSATSVPANASALSSNAPNPNSNPSPDPSMAISAALPQATVGTAYKGSVNVTGGTSPYTFLLASGDLPKGVQLSDSDGTISGTPATSGNFSFSLSVSDAKGVSKQQSLQMTVANATTGSGGGSGSGGSGSGGKSFTHLQQASGWGQYGQGPPSFIDCSPSPCDGITFSMAQNVASPSMSGAASEFNLGGTAVYTDALFNNHLIGPFSSQGLPDTSKTLVPTLHNFTYDVYFFSANLELSQAVEFDINQFFNSMGFIWGHECRVAGGNEWDIWDNQKQHWTPTGVPCYPNNNAWNHLVIQVQRTSNNELLYQSITLNGVTHALNLTYPPGSAPSDWYGVTVNYQMDGNYKQQPYSVYLDELTFTYQ